MNHPGPAAVAGEDGVTLVEVLVTMSILLLVAIVGAVVLSKRKTQVD